MNPLKTLTTAIPVALLSTPVLAHVGDHAEMSVHTAIAHLLTEHPLPAALIALLATGLLVKRLLRT